MSLCISAGIRRAATIPRRDGVNGKHPAAIGSSAADERWHENWNRVMMTTFVMLESVEGRTRGVYRLYLSHTQEQKPDQRRRHEPRGAYQTAELTVRVLGG